MKKPKLSDLRINGPRTKQIRDQAKKSNKVKITIYIDGNSLSTLKGLAEKNGSKYQTLLNKILKDSLTSVKNDNASRLDKIERELKELRTIIKKAA
jgi:predicted DNA binding CopG/RHH family protein